MRVFRAVSALGGILVAARVSAAQHNIVISDSLAANADTLTVKRGGHWFGRIPKWRFGDYAVASSKLSPTGTRTKGNLFGTRTESRSSGKFSFVLTNGTGDSASVQAEHTTTIHSLDNKSENGWAIPSDDVWLDSEDGTAHITINGDTADSWALVLGVRVAHRRLHSETALTNGARKIVLADVSSDTHGRFDLRGVAGGYEFTEDGRSLGALQYFGGTLGTTNIVWMLRSADARTKLLLAAAMTAVLQMMSPELGPPEPGP